MEIKPFQEDSVFGRLKEAASLACESTHIMLAGTV